MKHCKQRKNPKKVLYSKQSSHSNYWNSQKIVCLTALLAIVFTFTMPSKDISILQAADILDNIIIKAPDKEVTNLAISASTMDSVTLTWTKAADAQTYYISYWESGKPSTSVDKDDIGNVSEYKITNLSQAKYIFQIQPANKLRTGIPLKGSAVSIEGAPAACVPTSIKLNHLKEGYCSFFIDGLNDIYKSEVEFYDATGNLLESFDGNSTGASLEDPEIKNNSFYAARVRGYYDQAGGYRSYGDWTEPYYVSTSIKPIKLSQKNGIAIVKWTNVQGADNYTVYISKNASNGFKKAVTTQNAAATVAKYGNAKLKAGTTYYIKVRASMTIDGETYTTSSAAKKIKMK